MVNAIAGVDLDQLHDVIEEKLRTQFPVFKLVQFYRDEEERKGPSTQELPALLLELARAPSQRVAPQQNFTNTFTIHAAPGQDPKQIAQEAVKLMRQETAVAHRSSNLDWGYSQ